MQRPSTLQRNAAYAVVVGGVIGILYSPFHAAAYLATESGSPPLLAWDQWFRDAFPVAFNFDTAQNVYLAFGHVAPFVMLGLFAGILALHSSQKHVLTKTGTWAFRLLFVGQGALVVGTTVEFYTPYLEAGFLISGPAMLLVIATSVWYGILTIRAKIMPRGAAWLLTLGGPAVFPMIALFGHIPLAMMFTYVAWIWIGFTLLVRDPSETHQPAMAAAR